MFVMVVWMHAHAAKVLDFTASHNGLNSEVFNGERLGDYQLFLVMKTSVKDSFRIFLAFTSFLVVSRRLSYQ